MERPANDQGVQHPCLNDRQQVDGNIELEGGWSEAFSTAANEPTLVARAGIFTPGRAYTFSLTATDSDGAVGYAGKPKYHFTIAISAVDIREYVA